MTVKVAMVLAVMDSAELPVVVSLAHYARAQQIVEGWRASLHHIWEQQAETEDETNARRIYDWIRQHGSATSRLLQQRLHIHARPVREALQVLEESGQVERREQGRTTIWVTC
jgi:DNA-binding GntR family transcriptional regulator